MGYVNQRTAFGETLVALGEKNNNIFVLDADLGGSTMGKLFELKYPERHLEMGIAEANMTSVAAGLAQTGKIPFVNTFAVFAAGRAYDQIRQTIAIGKLNVKVVGSSAGLAQTGKIPFVNTFAVFAAGRAYDQIRQTIAIGKLNVKIAGSSAGLSDFGDGATHQSVEDMAIMRAIPNMVVINPADANEMVEATKAIADYCGPVYLRVNRNDYDNVTPEGKPFKIGEPSVLKEGKDVVVFATGYPVSLALAAAEALKDEVSVKVVNVSTIKPLNDEKIIELAADCEAVVTAEEHNIVGGLGSAVAEALRKSRKPIEFVGVEDTFGCSAHNYTELLEHFGITKEHIVKAILSVR